MGNLKAEYLEQTYIDLAPLKDAEDCRTYLTRSQVDGSLAVRKEICALQYPLYQQLIDFPIPVWQGCWRLIPRMEDTLYWKNMSAGLP